MKLKLISADMTVEMIAAWATQEDRESPWLAMWSAAPTAPTERIKRLLIRFLNAANRIENQALADEIEDMLKELE